MQLILVVISSAAFFGLAVLGRGGFEVFFSNPALIALVITGLAMVVVALFSPGNLSAGVREARSSR